MCIKKINEFGRKFHNPDLASLFLRLAVGIVFVNAGLMKVMDIGMTVEGFATMGIPAYLAYFVAYAELICGAMVLVGLLSRYASFVLAVIMLVAVALLAPNGFSMMNGGFEYPLVMLLASLAIVTMGCGKFSLARLLKW